jgi:hypothetical protein
MESPPPTHDPQTGMRITKEAKISGLQRDELRRTISWMWNNGPSAIARNARVMLTTLMVDGELLLTPRVNTSDGRVTLTQKNSDDIDELKIGEGLGRVQALTFSGDDKEYQVIAEDVDGVTLVGDLFYYRSRYSGHSITHRGVPLLAPVLDEVAALTEFVYKRLTKLAELSSYYWDVTISGASQESVDEFLESPKSVPPEAGEVMAHNEQVQWDFVSTDFANIADELNAHINHLAGASGLTPEFVGHSPGRDVSTESLFSAIAHLTTLRDDVFSIVAELVRYQLQQAKNHNGAIQAVPDFKLVAEEIGSRSMQRAAQAFIRYADGLAKAKQEGLISADEASKVLRMLLIRLGLISEEDIPSKYDAPVWRSR